MNIVERPPRAVEPAAEDAGNLSFVERAIYVTLGLGLAATAARPRPNPVLSGLALIAGSYLAWRGGVGNDPVKRIYNNLRDEA